MPKSLQLQIPEPCHENWNSMTPKEQGRYCGSCCKTVVDFSMMTDKEIVDYISKASHHICGRFSNDQLNKDISITEKKKRFSFAYLWNVLLATFLITEANAQSKPVKKKKTIVHEVPTQVLMGKFDIVEEPEPATTILPLNITGTVLDSTTNKPLMGASIRIKETARGVAADTLGNFMLHIEKKNAVELEFSAIGYETQTLLIDNNTPVNLAIHLKPVAALLQSVEVKAFAYHKALTGSVGGISIGYRLTRVEKIKRVINDWVPKKDVRVYPNPVVRGNNIQVSLALKQTGTYKLELLNAGGQVMEVQPLMMRSKEQLATIPTSHAWSAGVYWIRISSPNTKNVYQAKVLLK